MYDKIQANPRLNLIRMTDWHFIAAMGKTKKTTKNVTSGKQKSTNSVDVSFGKENACVPSAGAPDVHASDKCQTVTVRKPRVNLGRNRSRSSISKPGKGPVPQANAANDKQIKCMNAGPPPGVKVSVAGTSSIQSENHHHSEMVTQNTFLSSVYSGWLTNARVENQIQQSTVLENIHGGLMARFSSQPHGI
ncbi:unnamed protein product [Calypogeia fissa]